MTKDGMSNKISKEQNVERTKYRMDKMSNGKKCRIDERRNGHNVEKKTFQRDKMSNSVNTNMSSGF